MPVDRLTMIRIEYAVGAFHFGFRLIGWCEWGLPCRTWFSLQRIEVASSDPERRSPVRCQGTTSVVGDIVFRHASSFSGVLGTYRPAVTRRYAILDSQRSNQLDGTPEWRPDSLPGEIEFRQFAIERSLSLIHI